MQFADVLSPLPDYSLLGIGLRLLGDSLALQVFGFLSLFLNVYWIKRRARAVQAGKQTKYVQNISESMLPGMHALASYAILTGEFQLREAVWLLGALASSGLLVAFTAHLYSIISKSNNDKYNLHTAALLSDSPRRVHRRLTRVGAGTIILRPALLLLAFVLHKYAFVTNVPVKTLIATLTFAIFPLMDFATAYAAFHNRLLSESNVDDSLRVRATVMALARLSLPTAFALFLSHYMDLNFTIIAVNGQNINIITIYFVLTAMVAAWIIWHMYVGSSNFTQQQILLQERKREFIRAIGKLSLLPSHEASARRIQLAARILAELRTFVNEDAVVRYAFGHYCINEQPEFSASEDHVVKIARFIFELEEEEINRCVAKFDEIMNVMASVPAVAEMGWNPEMDGLDTAAKSLFACILVPFLEAAPSMADEVRIIIEKNLHAIRNWDLRFWYGFDLIDYAFMLMNPRIDLGRITETRVTDVDVMELPKHANKTVVTAVLAAITWAVSKFGISEQLTNVVRHLLSSN